MLLTTKLFTLFLLGVGVAAFSGYMLGRSSVPGESARADGRPSAPRGELEWVDANSAGADLRRALATERARSDELETECDALRVERDALRAEIDRAGSRRAPPVAAELAQRKRKQRKDRLLSRWNQIFGDPLLNGELPDSRRRGMFAELYADLKQERTSEEIRHLYDAFLIGYRPYRRAMDDFDARAKFIRDAVELRRESENLARLQRGLYTQVLPLLTEEERRAFETGPEAD